MKQVDPLTRKITWRMPAVKICEAAALKPCVHAFCRARAKLSRYTAVNTLSKGKAGVTLRFLKHADNKSDGFLLLDQGEKELHVYLIDGGLATGESFSALLRLRESILQANGLANKVHSPRYKLHVTLLISHFHIDHVNDLLHNVLPCRKFLRVTAAYFGAPSVFTKDTNHFTLHNGDLSHRPNFLRIAACYQPMMEKHVFAFGESGTLPLQNGKIEFFMPPKDWGEKQTADFIAEYYQQNDPKKVYESLSVGVVNANSLWMRITSRGQSLLLTGDVTKRFDDKEEAMNQVIAYYGEKLRSHVVKMPHHGLGRNQTVALIKAHLLIPGEHACVVLTGNKGEEIAGDTLREYDLPFIGNNQGEIEFSFTEGGLIRTAKGAN